MLTTSIENLHNILKVNALLSYNELIKQGNVVNTVRFELREPEDFLDYIDFCSCESISSEIVVASRQFGKINELVRMDKTSFKLYLTKKIYDFKAKEWKDANVIAIYKKIQNL